MNVRFESSGLSSHHSPSDRCCALSGPEARHVSIHITGIKVPIETSAPAAVVCCRFLIYGPGW